MLVTKVRKVVGNPHRSRKRRARKRNARHRRKMTAKQIRHFGTKAQRAALKASRKRKRNASGSTKKRRRRRRATTKRRRVKVVYVERKRKRKTNPKRRKRRRKAKGRKNPARMLTLGFLNPRKRRKKAVAKTKKRRRRRASKTRNRRRSVSRRRNSSRMTVVRTRKRRRGRRRGVARSRNPFMFGRSARPLEVAKYVAGGLIGVTVTKTVLPMLPSVLTGNNIMRVLSSVAVAFAAGWAASKLNSDFGSAVLFGGLMQAGSMALNAFIPPVGRAIGLSGRGLREFVPARFTIPENPVVTGMGPAKTVFAMSPAKRAYGAAY